MQLPPRRFLPGAQQSLIVDQVRWDTKTLPSSGRQLGQPNTLLSVLKPHLSRNSNVGLDILFGAF